MKYWRIFITLVVVLAFFFGGLVMIVQGLSAKEKVKAGIIAENMTIGKDPAAEATGHAGEAVTGVATLEAMADVIEHHAFLNEDGTPKDGSRYAEIKRIPKLDESGDAVLNEDGTPVMVSPPERAVAQQAATLIAMLNLGIVGFKVADLVIGLGALFMLLGLRDVTTKLPDELKRLRA